MNEILFCTLENGHQKTLSDMITEILYCKKYMQNNVSYLKK